MWSEVGIKVAGIVVIAIVLFGTHLLRPKFLSEYVASLPWQQSDEQKEEKPAAALFLIRVQAESLSSFPPTQIQGKCQESFRRSQMFEIQSAVLFRDSKELFVSALPSLTTSLCS